MSDSNENIGEQTDAVTRCSPL